MTTEQHKAIVRRLYEEAFNHTGDLSVADEFIAPDFVDRTAPPGLPPGREGFKLLVGGWRHAFPDIRLTIDAIVAEGDQVVVAWTGTGTHRGELMGIPPTGNSGSLMGITFNRMAGGQVVERWGNSDDLGLLQKLGVIPGPPA
jgi:predicted ester cyclase